MMTRYTVRFEINDDELFVNWTKYTALLFSSNVECIRDFIVGSDVQWIKELYCKMTMDHYYTCKSYLINYLMPVCSDDFIKKHLYFLEGTKVVDLPAKKSNSGKMVGFTFETSRQEKTLLFLFNELVESCPKITKCLVSVLQPVYNEISVCEICRSGENGNTCS